MKLKFIFIAGLETVDCRLRIGYFKNAWKEAAVDTLSSIVGPRRGACERFPLRNASSERSRRLRARR
jgi:hypothetical protein